MKVNIKQLLDAMNAPQREELKAWLLENLEHLKSLDNVEASLNPIKSAIELRASKKAYLLLKEMFSEAASFSPRDQRTKNDPKDRFDV